jgi:hypothetical protein
MGQTIKAPHETNGAQGDTAGHQPRKDTPGGSQDSSCSGGQAAIYAATYAACGAHPSCGEGTKDSGSDWLHTADSVPPHPHH